MIHMVCYILDQPSALCTLRIKSDIPTHTLLHLTGPPLGLSHATNTHNTAPCHQEDNDGDECCLDGALPSLLVPRTAL